MSDNANKTLNIKEIMARIPHRYPLLLLDRIKEVGDSSITAIKNVTMNEQFFQGHFPEHPIMPGVLIVEALAQAAAVLVNKDSDFEGKVVYFTSIEKVQFRKPVTPGDQLILKVEIDRAKGKFYKFQGVAYVDDERVANAVFSAAIMDK